MRVTCPVLPIGTIVGELDGEFFVGPDRRYLGDVYCISV
jgi:hypothetical protein